MKIVHTLLILIVSTSIFAQATSKKSFAIANNGDTIWGVIKDKEFNVSPTSFKLNDTKYTVDNVTSFTTEDGTLYKRYTITYHTAPINESNMAFGDEAKTKSTIAFLKVLVNAKKGLAEFRTPERLYFYLLNNQQAVELYYVKGTVSFESKAFENDARYGKTIVLEKTDYKQQLDSLNDNTSKDIASKITNASYDENSITKIVRLANGLNENVPSKINNSLQIGFGFNYYSNTINSGTTNALRDIKIDNNIAPALSIAYKISPKRKVNRSSYIFGLVYSNYNVTGERTTQTTEKKYVLEVKNSYLDIYAKYLFTINPESSVKLSLAAGINYSMLVSKKNTTYSTSFSDVIIATENTIPFRSSLVNPVFALHIAFNKFEISANYIMPQELSNFEFGSWKTSRLSANLFYNFNLK